MFGLGTALHPGVCEKRTPGHTNKVGGAGSEVHIKARKMPSVETQTPWSWLKDFALISELNSSHQAVNFSLSQHEIRGLEETIAG